MSFTIRPFSRWVLLLAGFALAACETGRPSVLVNNAQGTADGLPIETTRGVTLPPGCATSTASVPAGKKSLTISYQVPTTDQSGAPLKGFMITTVYLSSPGGQTQAIRVPANRIHGGASVTIQNVAPPAQEFALCVTVTNWAGQESPPALLTPSAR